MLVVLRASVGSTEASASLLARVGVVGPKRLAVWQVHENGGVWRAGFQVSGESEAVRQADHAASTPGFAGLQSAPEMETKPYHRGIVLSGR